MKAFGKIFDAVFLTRPVVLIPVWGFAVFGYFRGTAAGGDFDVSLLWNPGQLKAFAGIVLFSVSVGVVYVLNQIADVEVDGENKGFALMAHGGISRLFAWRTAAGWALFGTIAAAVWSPPLVLFMALAIATGAAYSFKPLYLSGRPFADFLANAAGFGGIAFGAGWALAGADVVSRRFLVSALPYFFLMCAGSISSTLPDYEGDRRCGKNTTAVTLGLTGAHAVASLCLLASLVSSFLVNDIVAGFCAVTAAPLYCLYFLHGTVRVTEAVYKAGGAVCMLCAGILMPVFIAAAAAAWCATMLYFRIRFHVLYPSLMPVKNEK
jgi:4-hydroxybenzoate polyprenyltransferase